MDLNEGRQLAEAEGTTRWEKAKWNIRIAFATVVGIFALLLVTYWTYDAVQENTNKASDKTVPDQTVSRPAQQCTGEVFQLPKGASEADINPSKLCYVYLRVWTGKYRIEGASGVWDVDPNTAITEVNVLLFSAKGLTSNATGQYIRCPDKKKNWSNWSCT